MDKPRPSWFLLNGLLLLGVPASLPVDHSRPQCCTFHQGFSPGCSTGILLRHHPGTHNKKTRSLTKWSYFTASQCNLLLRSPATTKQYATLQSPCPAFSRPFSMLLIERISTARSQVVLESALLWNLENAKSKRPFLADAIATLINPARIDHVTPNLAEIVFDILSLLPRRPGNLWGSGLMTFR